MEEVSPGGIAGNAAAAAVPLSRCSRGTDRRAPVAAFPAITAALNTAGLMSASLLSSSAATAIPRYTHETAAAVALAAVAATDAAGGCITSKSDSYLRSVATSSCAPAVESPLSYSSSFSPGGVCTVGDITSPSRKQFLPVAAAEREKKNFLLLLDDKVLLLLLSFLTRQEQLLSFLCLSRQAYTAALRLPFLTCLLLPSPGNAFDIFHHVRGVSFFPPHNLSVCPDTCLSGSKKANAIGKKNVNLRESAETSDLECSIESPDSSRETPHSSRKTSYSSTKALHSSTESSCSTAEIQHSSRETPHSSSEIPRSSRETPHSSREISHSSRETSDSNRETLQGSTESLHSSRETPYSRREASKCCTETAHSSSGIQYEGITGTPTVNGRFAVLPSSTVSCVPAISSSSSSSSSPFSSSSSGLSSITSSLSVSSSSSSSRHNISSSSGAAVVGSSSGIFTSSRDICTSEREERLSERRASVSSASTASNNSCNAICVPGACPCCCIPFCFFSFSQLVSADIAAPALIPPSPLLALLLLIAARSLKHLRVRGVDEGSFSWKASIHSRAHNQEHEIAEQQHQQQQAAEHHEQQHEAVEQHLQHQQAGEHLQQQQQGTAGQHRQQKQAAEHQQQQQLGTAEQQQQQQAAEQHQQHIHETQTFWPPPHQVSEKGQPSDAQQCCWRVQAQEQEEMQREQESKQQPLQQPTEDSLTETEWGSKKRKKETSREKHMTAAERSGEAFESSKAAADRGSEAAAHSQRIVAGIAVETATESADGIVADNGESSIHKATAIDRERQEALTATTEGEGSSYKGAAARHKRIRLKEDKEQSGSEDTHSWQAMLRDSVCFAATACITPTVLDYMWQLHRRSIKQRNIPALREGFAIFVSPQGSKQTAESISKAARAAGTSDKDIVPPSSHGSCAQPMIALPGAAVSAPIAALSGGANPLATSPHKRHSIFSPNGKQTTTAKKGGDKEKEEEEKEEQEEEERCYWLPKKALDLLLTSARNLETLAIDVSRRKGMFRVAPLARLFLVEKEDEKSTCNGNSSRNMNSSFREECDRDQQHNKRPQQQPSPPVIVSEGHISFCAGGAHVAEVQHNCKNKHGEQPYQSSFFEENPSFTEGSGICRTPLLSGEAQQETCYEGRGAKNAWKLLLERDEALSFTRRPEETQGEKRCTRLRELEVCNITPVTFVCGYISLPQLRVLKLHFVEIASGDREGLHDLGGLLQGCPLLEDFAVHTDSDDDQMVFLNRLIIRSLRRFLRWRKSRKNVLPTNQIIHAVHRADESRREEEPQHDQQQEGLILREQEKGAQQEGQEQRDRYRVHQHNSARTLTGPGGFNVVANQGSSLPCECEMVLLDENTHIKTLQHLKSFQIMLLDIRVIDLLAKAAPNLQILRLIETEAFRSPEGRNVLVEAARRLPKLRRVELLGDLNETEGRSMLEGLFDAEGRARDWRPGVLSFHHGAKVIHNFFLPSR